MQERLVVLGAGESGIGAAILAKKQGFDVFLSDKKSISEELKEFLEKLPQGAFDKIRKFFDTMPRLRHEQEVTNPKTGVKSTVTFSGLQDFFGLASPIVA